MKEQLKHLLKKRFGSSSQKISQGQLGLFNEAEETLSAELPETTETAMIKSHARARKPRTSIPDSFPWEDIVHDIPDSEKACPHDGTALEVIGSEDLEQLDIVQATIKVIRHVRLTYACPCCDNHIFTASKPKLSKRALPALACSLISQSRSMPMLCRFTDKVTCSSVSASILIERTWLIEW